MMNQSSKEEMIKHCNATKSKIQFQVDDGKCCNDNDDVIRNRRCNDRQFISLSHLKAITSLLP
jgi:hypothetical protein